MLLLVLVSSSVFVGSLLLSPQSRKTARTKTATSTITSTIKLITSIDDDDFRRVQQDRKRSGYGPEFGSSNECTYVAKRNGDICGSADVEIVYLKKSWGSTDINGGDEMIQLPFIKNVLTNPEYRQMGVATDLLKHIEKRYRKQHDYLYLHVLKSNTQALNLYKKFNFIEVGLDDTNCDSNGSSGTRPSSKDYGGSGEERVGGSNELKLQLLKDTIEKAIDPFIFPRPRILMRKRLNSNNGGNNNKGFTDKQIILAIENKPPNFHRLTVPAG